MGFLDEVRLGNTDQHNFSILTNKQRHIFVTKPVEEFLCHTSCSPAQPSATQEADPTAPTCDVTCTLYTLIHHNHTLYPRHPPLSHTLQNPLITHLHHTSSRNSTLCYYCVLLNISILQYTTL